MLMDCGSMTFNIDMKTPLFIKEWVPKNNIQYFFTLIFIIIISIFYRAISTYKLQWKCKQKIVCMNCSKLKEIDIYYRPEIMRSENNKYLQTMPSFRLSVDFYWAFLQFVTYFFSYLLMILVMSMNIGYFFAVLVGIFIGEVVFSRYNYAFIRPCEIP
ncbi:hypothetical protein PNEG_00579 [Pneumocystis murina B123]|uniref:Copper transport protein n=1 Tax=Pneumocystis murina (strain B123) TaxID=1069680 RepID=M7NV24_PNEMU|nr:hypothetical protein PNEG_00579 [Pneumocystis murina B123]EMR10976.1 hypothetical protein PNEG_00579 [Pneumocystis murina B123]